jgi:2,4-dienoyl-CoA reductase-like NADH-dependent reductase (Old Yellow Enzyme family)
MNHKFAKIQFGIGRLTAIAASVLILSGCGSSPPIISAKNLPDAEEQSLNRMQEVIAAESKKLLAQQAQMVEQIRQLSSTVSKPVEPKAPVFDPLEGKNVSIAISNASISQVLAIFSDAAQKSTLSSSHLWCSKGPCQTCICVMCRCVMHSMK